MNKQRIEFVDLAKGVCILLVVFSHCGVGFPIPGEVMLRMPLYFILSGLFFKDYGGFIEFLVKKTNKILIPFVFFYLTAYLIFYLIKMIAPHLIISDAKGILDIFNNRQYFNGPIWFLLCLFFVNIYFCVISLNIKNEYIRGLIVLIIGFIGIELGENEVFLPFFMDVAMTALPYFYFGYLLKKTPLLYRNKYDRYNFMIALGCYAVTYLIIVVFENPHMSFHYNKMYGNVFINYLGSFSCVIAVLMLCKLVGKLPLVSYCGRYSIILLGLHHMIYRPLLFILNDVNGGRWIVAVITIMLCVAMIPICVRFIPAFTAQKDLFTYKRLASEITNGKVQ